MFVAHSLRIQSGKWNGLLLAFTVAVAASFLASHFHIPRILCALILGMGFSSVSAHPKFQEGLDFSSKNLLRLGIALLGARIGFIQIRDLGIAPIFIVSTGLVSTIAIGWLIAKMFRRPISDGLLSGGAVAICGASAALALSAVMPQTARNQRFTLLTVVGVTLLSTVAMVIYPWLARWYGLSESESAVFLGGSIHDVAQVVGAGMMISNGTGEAATLVKLIRVSLLLPAVLFFTIVFRASAESSQITASTSHPHVRPPLLPGFLVAFLILVFINIVFEFPPLVLSLAASVSQWLILVAIAALGVKTVPRQLTELGWMPVLMLVSESFWIAGWVFVMVVLAR